MYLLIRVSRVRTPDRAVGHCFCDVEGRGDGDFFVSERKISFPNLRFYQGEKCSSLMQ